MSSMNTNYPISSMLFFGNHAALTAILALLFCCGVIEVNLERAALVIPGGVILFGNTAVFIYLLWRGNAGRQNADYEKTNIQA